MKSRFKSVRFRYSIAMIGIASTPDRMWRRSANHCPSFKLIIRNVFGLSKRR